MHTRRLRKEKLVTESTLLRNPQYDGLIESHPSRQNGISALALIHD